MSLSLVVHYPDLGLWQKPAQLTAAALLETPLASPETSPVSTPSRTTPATIFARGDALGLRWDRGKPLEHTGPDTWGLTLDTSEHVAGLVSTFLRLKFLLDDETWQRGADTMVEVPMNGAHTELDCYPWFWSERGRIVWLRDVWSPQLRNARDVGVYLPPSFDENTRKSHHNVVVMHDGQNLFDAQTAFAGVAWRCDSTVDRCIFSGDMAEVVIVAINNTDDRLNELSPFYDHSWDAGGLLGPYLDFVEQTVLPKVVAEFAGRIVVDRTSLGSIGSSLGGLASFYAVWTRSKMWAKCGCMSGTFEWGGNALLNGTLCSTRPVYPITIYLDSGDTGPGLDSKMETLDVKQYLERLGWIPGKTLFYFLDEGAEHTEAAWGARFWRPCMTLYPPVFVHPRLIAETATGSPSLIH